MSATSLRKRLVFSAIAALAPLLLLEIGCRVRTAVVVGRRERSLYYQSGSLNTGGAGMYRPHHWLLYELRPDHDASFGRGTVHHDPRGFRGPEVPVAKPEGVCRIACLGGSTTYCTAIYDDAATYPARLQARLRAAHGDGVEVVNAGVGGYTSAESLIQLQFKLIGMRPDAAIVLSGINDADARLRDGLVADYSNYRRGWLPPEPTLSSRLASASHFFAYLFHERPGIPLPDASITTLVNHPPSSDEARAVAGSSSEYFRRNLVSTVAVCRAYGIVPILMTQTLNDVDPRTPRYRAAVAQHNDAVRGVCRELGVALIDLAAEFPAEPALYEDMCHVNADGADVVARIVAEALDRIPDVKLRR